MELETQAQEGKKKDQEKTKEKENEKKEKKKKKGKEDKTKGGVRNGSIASAGRPGKQSLRRPLAGRLVGVRFGVRAYDGWRRRSQGQRTFLF